MPSQTTPSQANSNFRAPLSSSSPTAHEEGKNNNLLYLCLFCFNWFQSSIKILLLCKTATSEGLSYLGLVPFLQLWNQSARDNCAGEKRRQDNETLYSQGLR